MADYKYIPREDFDWKLSEVGTETARLIGSEVMMSIVKGDKGTESEYHSHSVGAFTYVVKGKIKVAGHTLEVGDAGWCRPGSGRYRVEFLEDSEYVVCRAKGDQITKLDQAE